jgi:hypothetical protein
VREAAEAASHAVVTTAAARIASVVTVPRDVAVQHVLGPRREQP